MKATMDEFKNGQLRSGSKKGPVVKNRKQAIAIGLLEARKASPKSAKAPKTPKAPSMPRIMHPGEADALPTMHSSKHH